VSSVHFAGCHAECRSNVVSGDRSCITLEGFVYACTWDAFHLSGGSSVTADQSDYGWKFKIDRDSGNTDIRGITIDGVEVLRVKTAGFVVGIEGDVLTNIDEPNKFNGLTRNATTPDLIEYGTGVNEDLIRNSTFLDGEVGNRNFVSITDDTVVSFAPRAQEGTISINTNTLIQYGGIALYDVGGGGVADAHLVGGGTDFEVGVGVPTGTTGTDTKVTLFAADDGNLYIENRAGFTIQLSTKVLSEYKVSA
jgi:hypothetical protein